MKAKAHQPKTDALPLDHVTNLCTSAVDGTFCETNRMLYTESKNNKPL